MPQPEPAPSHLHEKSLNTLLDQLDSRLGKLEAQTGRQAADILRALDEVQERFDALRAQEHLLSVEKDQFEYLQNRLRKNAALALRDLGGAAALQALREERRPPRERWWWHLEAYISHQRSQGVKRSAIIALAAVALIAVLAAAYQLFLAPDPAVVAATRLQNEAQLQIIDGDIDGAIQSIDLAIAQQPEDLELQVFKGVLLEQAGRVEDAAGVYAGVEEKYGSREAFLTSRSLLKLQSMAPEGALEDALAVIEINPESPVAHYYAASAYESLGRLPEALEMYDAAFTLAEKQGQSELAATIRINYAMLQQSVSAMQSIPLTTPTE